jgi:hypothetical protein
MSSNAALTCMSRKCLSRSRAMATSSPNTCGASLRRSSSFIGVRTPDTTSSPYSHAQHK